MSNRLALLLQLSTVGMLVVLGAVLVALQDSQDNPVLISDASLDLLVGKVESRTEFSVCVGEGGGALDATAERMGLVEDALDFAFRGRDDIPRSLSSDCPSPYALEMGVPLDWTDHAGFDAGGKLLEPEDDPSPHTWYLYFVQSGVYRATFPDTWPYVTVGAELRCEGDVCRSVTGAMYLTGNISLEQVRYAMLDTAVNLVPSPLDACFGEGKRRLSWCRDYERYVEQSVKSR